MRKGFDWGLNLALNVSTSLNLDFWATNTDSLKFDISTVLDPGERWVHGSPMSKCQPGRQQSFKWARSCCDLYTNKLLAVK